MNEKLKKDLCIKKGHFLTSMRLLALFLFSGVSLFLNANSNRKERGVLSYVVGQPDVRIYEQGKNADILRQVQNETRMLTGIITDKVTGEPLVGVTIQVKGKPNLGCITDVNGRYKLTGIISDDDITISYIGYTTRTLRIGNVGELDIQLTPADAQMGEVVVIGAGTQRKISVTGSISTVSGNDLRTPSSSLTNNLAGKLAGVIAKTNSGEPGSVGEFYIRGVSTFGGRTRPLILLDDVEIFPGDLDRIPPETIKSFTILKDASATAIYGARGANGVMIITTKTGEKNTKTAINVTLEASYLHPVNRVKFVDGPTYMRMYNEALITRHPSATPRYSEDAIENTIKGVNPYVYPNVNWYDQLFKSGCFNQRANLNVSGGGNRIAYYMSLQSNHNTGLLNTRNGYAFNNNYNNWEYIFQNNLTYDLTNTTKVGLRMNTQIGNTKGPNIASRDLLWDTFQNDPVTFPVMFPAQEGDKHIRFGNAVMSDSRLFVNPYAKMLSTYRELNYATFNTSLNVTQELDFITKGLNVTALVNWKQYASSNYSRSITPYYYRVVDGSWQASDPNAFETELLRSGTDFISQSDITKHNDDTFYFDARLNYSRRFGGHTVGGMLMYMMREYREEVYPSRNQGLSGRFTYDYNNTYLAEINFGYNGTERLAKGQRFEFFPAASIGWVVSNEKFWKPVSKYIDFLKLRCSYGLVGNDDTGEDAGAAHFLYINEVNVGDGGSYTTGPYNGSPYNITKKGPGVVRYAVEDAHWERVKEFDLGLDLRLFNQLDIVFDYFHHNTDRILMRRGSFPTILGYWSAIPFSNIGKVDNKGFELAVVWNTNINKELHVEVRGNLTYNQNKYVYVDDPDYPYVWQTRTGKPLSHCIGYIAEGLFKSEEVIRLHADQSGLGSTPMVGDIKYRDVNGDGKITTEDRVMISEYGSLPRMQYGIGVNLTWKKLDFGVFFNGSAKIKKILQGFQPFHANNSSQRTVMQWVADSYWAESNPDANASFPRLGLSESDDANNQPSSTFWLRDFSFLRWKTLEIGYSFRHCRLYFSGDNLAVFSPFKYWDPEIWWNSYPLQRTFNIGVQIKI